MVENIREHQTSGNTMRWQSSQLEETLDSEHWGGRAHMGYRQELGIHSWGSDAAPPGTGRCLRG